MKRQQSNGPPPGTDKSVRDATQRALGESIHESIETMPVGGEK